MSAASTPITKTTVVTARQTFVVTSTQASLTNALAVGVKKEFVSAEGQALHKNNNGENDG